jgi:chromosome partitioning protein
MKVVTFSIFKGGTGKTTSTVNAAAALAKKGKHVLLVDLDQQASATRYLGLDPMASPNLYEVYMGTKSPALAIRQTNFGIDVLASHPYMAAIEAALEPGDELRLSGYLQPLRPEYDFILIDNPPGKARLSFSGLSAADLIVVACSAERMAADGVADLIDYLQRTLWIKFPDLAERQDLRILFTMFRPTTSHSPKVVSNAQKVWRDNVLGITIPHTTLFSRSYEDRKPVAAIDPKHPGAIAYDVFADWLIKYEETTN